MQALKLRLVRTISLTFLLPGLAGLITAASVSAHYLQTLPQTPDPLEQRMTPRNIHGSVVYQTESEDRRLSILEYSSVSVFLVGLATGFVYLRKWGIANALGAEDEELAASERN